MVGDHLAICVPTRNIETWLLWLQGRRDLDEIEDYKRAVEAIGYLKETAKLWFAPGDAHLESSRLPSLAHGRKEIARLKLVSKL